MTNSINPESDSDILPWLLELPGRLALFMGKLRTGDKQGRYRHCRYGLTQEGGQLSLGVSCFALKIYYTMGWWDLLATKEKQHWLDFLKSFQVANDEAKYSIMSNAIVDPFIVEYSTPTVTWKQKFAQILFGREVPSVLQQVVVAETKQTIATLAQVGDTPYRPYKAFPTTPKSMRETLESFDWSKPWGAGGQAAAFVVFAKTQAPAFLSVNDSDALIETCRQFFYDLADKNTGAYFAGGLPEHGELINGAMKVLTALDWLGTPVHFPEQLVDTCLQQWPSEEGCHLVDAVYVIYRCFKTRVHNETKVKAFCEKVLEMIKAHHNRDGGFSYYKHKSQTHYYNVQVSDGKDESDIHGTCLLVWAIAMIVEILKINRFGWQVIKP